MVLRLVVLQCVLAGAGDAGFIDAFTDHLLFSIPASPHMRTFEDHVRERLDSFYTKHVLPAVAVDRNADFQMLIGPIVDGKRHFT